MHPMLDQMSVIYLLIALDGTTRIVVADVVPSPGRRFGQCMWRCIRDGSGGMQRNWRVRARWKRDEKSEQEPVLEKGMASRSIRATVPQQASLFRTLRNGVSDSSPPSSFVSLPLPLTCKWWQDGLGSQLTWLWPWMLLDARHLQKARWRNSTGAAFPLKDCKDKMISGPEDSLDPKLLRLNSGSA